jgi:lipoprotein-anchoring transpeptidase ErfK/SrfK
VAGTATNRPAPARPAPSSVSSSRESSDQGRRPPAGTNRVLASRLETNRLATTNLGPAPPPGTARPAQNVLEAQLALAREAISPGSFDGELGSQTRAAVSAFQRKHGLAPTGLLDGETKGRLLVAPPLHSVYTVTSNDVERLGQVPKTWLGKSELPRLDYETVLELVAEKAFSHPQLIRRLNPDIDWEKVGAGARVTIPCVEYPPSPAKAAVVKISLSGKILEVFDAGTKLLAHFPCSIGRLAEKRPVGDLHVVVLAPNPNYTFNPEIFPESEEGRRLGRKLVLPAGPNNPVGVAWIGLDRPGYGIHGTPAPELVGRTESHGCFRLANWNAEYLLKLVTVGTTVVVEP